MGHYFRNAVLLPTLACLPFGAATAIVEWLAPASNLAVFFLEVILVLPLVPATAWLLCLSTEERDQAKSELRKRFSRRMPGPMQ